MARRPTRKGPPHPLLTALESRALLEIAALPYALPLLAGAPHGDGHPVLLVPGFIGDDTTLFALKQFLRWRGYRVETWGLGRNVGFQRKHARALEQKLRFMQHQAGRRVSIVGWSRGGVVALVAAHALPDSVRTVVPLGSPVSIDPRGSESPQVIKALYRLVAHPLGPEAHASHTRAGVLRRPPPVPTTCIYSETDGVVPPHEATIDGDPHMHENIRVPGSHVGLAFNALALWIIADRLAQPEGDWTPFEPSGALGWLYGKLVPSG
ncbi:MAG: alpha/beta hydrolase [Burkholderiales bacterium]|nr:MAG: alpha/beta hydrolase [Burkholderiales bacterium]